MCVRGKFIEVPESKHEGQKSWRCFSPWGCTFLDPSNFNENVTYTVVGNVKAASYHFNLSDSEYELAILGLKQITFLSWIFFSDLSKPGNTEHLEAISRRFSHQVTPTSRGPSALAISKAKRLSKHRISPHLLSLYSGYRFNAGSSFGGLTRPLRRQLLR